MKLFISWSGEFSQKVAETLSIWIPTIIQSVEVFFSPDDIAKGENWSNHLDRELKESSFGVICLTPENVTAPWIHFEAGALARSLDTRISSILLGVNPSEVQGPLSRYQHTVFKKEDFYRLFLSIDEASENRLKPSILRNAFDNAWGKLYDEISQIISSYPTSPAEEPVERDANSDALQEILRLVRKMDSSRTTHTHAKSLEPISYSSSSSSSMKKVIVSVERGNTNAAAAILLNYVTSPDTPHETSQSLRGYPSLRNAHRYDLLVPEYYIAHLCEQLNRVGATTTVLDDYD